MESRLFDVRTLDGNLDLLAAGLVGSQPDVRRHIVALEAAGRVLERRSRANTAPARLEGAMEGEEDVMPKGH